MGRRIDSILERIRADKGPFFIARLVLRVDFPLQEGEPDTPEREAKIRVACRELGYELRHD